MRLCFVNCTAYRWRGKDLQTANRMSCLTYCVIAFSVTWCVGTVNADWLRSKFTVLSDGERILKIGQHVVKGIVAHFVTHRLAGFWVTLYDPTSFSVACCLIYLFTQLCKISCCSLLLMWRSCNRCAVNRIDSVMCDYFCWYLNFLYCRTFFVPYRLIVQTCAKVIIRRRCHLQRTC